MYLDICVYVHTMYCGQLTWPTAKRNPNLTRSPKICYTNKKMYTYLRKTDVDLCEN